MVVDDEKEEKSTNETEKIQVKVEINTIPSELPVRIEHTNEDEIVDVEGLDDSEKKSSIESLKKIEAETNESEPKPSTSTFSEKKPEKVAMPIDDDIEVQLRNVDVKQSESKLSTSFPTQRSLWMFDNHSTIHTFTPILNRGSLNFGEVLSNNLRNERDAHLRHSLSTSLSRNEKTALNETMAMLRGISSCSKDTLIYVDRQNHRSMIGEDSNYMFNRSLWVRPKMKI